MMLNGDDVDDDDDAHDGGKIRLSATTSSIVFTFSKSLSLTSYTTTGLDSFYFLQKGTNLHQGEAFVCVALLGNSNGFLRCRNLFHLWLILSTGSRSC